MAFVDYYQLLGVARYATQDEIKRAYRKLARMYHPDVSREPDGEERFKLVSEAYEVLRDPPRRAAYDRLNVGRQVDPQFRSSSKWNDAPFGTSSYQFNADDSSGGVGGVKSYRHDHTFSIGRDCHRKVSIDLETAFHGATNSFALQLPDRDRAGRPFTRERMLSVYIPPGTREGQQIRLAGQGEPGVSGGAAGDLYLEIRFKPHPLYRVDGANLYATLPVAPWEAALGAAVNVPTPNGVVELKIPSGCQGNEKLRLKGRGLPGHPPGDLYMVLLIALPPADSERARDIYRMMARELDFNPRRSLGV
jgi:curved DNA-binding protein